ncbi:MAG: hypothetical protein CMB80_18995 [Flammeovirgaceae bacterium]|nr:hypothetical protein [Flammeovirgaceae bacterium]MBR07734.1 hypothetical protein [Rickettsiales bacterium]|tara:strand:- start:191 stop:382 length:192 start_codon:yes stop_codon:yes gene_type:complete
MITVLRRLVYFGALFIALMGIFMMLIKNDIGYVPQSLKLFLLGFVFFIGGMLVIVIAKRGLGG